MSGRFMIAGLVFAAAGCAHFEPTSIDAADSARRLQTRSLTAPTLLGFVQTNLPAPPAEWPPVAWNLDTLTLAGLFSRPDLEVVRARYLTALAGVGTASGRPNPTLNVTPGYNFSSVLSGPGSVPSPWFPAVNLDVPLETAGKRGYRRSVAEHRAEIARLAAAQQAWQVRGAIRSALLETAHAEARAQLLGEQFKVAEQLYDAARQSLAAGAITAFEANQNRSALERLRLDDSEARRQIAAARAHLADATGLPAAALATVRLDFQLDPGNQAGEEVAQPALRDAALLGRADVLAALAEFATSESALRLELARQYPDLHFGNGYQYDQGEHKWSLGLTLELPVLNRNQGPIAEAKAKREEAKAQFAAVQASALAQLDQAATGRMLALDALRQAEALIRSQGESDRLLEAAFQAGAADRLELLRARLELTAGQLARLDAVNRVQQAIGQLEDAVQRPFPGQSAVAPAPPLSHSP